MRDKAKKVGGIAVGGLGGLITVASQTSATDVASNLASWLKLAGMQRPPTAILGVPLDTAGLILGVLGLLGGASWLVWPPRKAPATTVACVQLPEVSEYLAIEDAARWLYEHSDPAMRERMGTFVPSLFKSRTEYAVALLRSAATEGVCHIYGRWDAGLPMEEIRAVDGELSSFEAMFGSERELPQDLAVLRGDLPKVLAFYQEDIVARQRPGSPERDKDLREGLGWIVVGEWGRTPETDGGGRLGEFVTAIETVRQAAYDRKITLWGRQSPAGLYEKIEPDYWLNHRIDELRAYYPSTEVVTRTTARDHRLSVLYESLMISCAEFEKAWPPSRPALAR